MARPPIESLLAATDFSPGAARAARRAAQLAAASGARLDLLHVTSDPSDSEAGRQMDAAAQELRASSGRVEAGELPGAILEAARDHDLLVLGANGASPLREALLGTTAERSLLHAQRPVLVVKREPEGPYRRVLVPCEYAPPARRALEAALRVAPGARLALVHVLEDEADEARTREWLSGLGEGLEGAANAELLAPAGSARDVIPELVRSLQADLVVMGKQGRSRIRDLFLGSVTRKVIATVDCDVLVAPLS